MSDDLVKECRSVMLHDNMLSGLMVHAQQVEKSMLRKNNREAKRSKSFASSSSKVRLEIQDNSRLKKTFSNQVPSKFPNACDERVSDPNSPSKNPTCGKCRSIMVIA